MEPIEFNLKDQTMHVEGFPDGAKVIALEGPIARRAGDLTLHQEDLTFALGCLQALDGQPLNHSVTQRALWHAAIVHFAKCFGSSKSRFSLEAKTVLKGLPPVALEAFEYVATLRDKHVVHDENSHHQALVGAIVNNGTKAYRVEKIIASVITGETLDSGPATNLRLLIDAALSWVRAEFDRVTKRLTDELEALPHAELLARPRLQLHPPKVEDLAKPRAR